MQPPNLLQRGTSTAQTAHKPLTPLSRMQVPSVVNHRHSQARKGCTSSLGPAQPHGDDGPQPQEETAAPEHTAAPHHSKRPQPRAAAVYLEAFIY